MADATVIFNFKNTEYFFAKCAECAKKKIEREVDTTLCENEIYFAKMFNKSIGKPTRNKKRE